MIAPWARIRDFALRARVGFFVSEDRFLPHWMASPFSNVVGMDWDRRVLFVCRRALRDGHAIGGMIHELGHMLATKAPPDEVDELTFVAWEWRLSLLLGVERQWWRKSMERYGIGGITSDEFGELSTPEQLRWMGERVVEGRRLGNLSATGRPVIVRRSK